MNEVLDTRPAQAVIRLAWADITIWGNEKLSVLQALLEERISYEHFQERWDYCDKMIDERVERINNTMAITIRALFPDEPWKKAEPTNRPEGTA